jgi:hypothetical protein
MAAMAIPWPMRAFGARFRTKTAIDSSHVHWQQMNALECLREDLSCGTISCFGSDPEKSKLLGLPKKPPDK